MPKDVEHLVSKLLAQKDFYPNKSEEDRKSIAYGIAYKQHNNKKASLTQETVFNLQKIAQEVNQINPEIGQGLYDLTKDIDINPAVNYNDGENLNPNIKSFVKNVENPVDKPTNTHAAKVTFVAPSSITESDIMKYILAIEDELGVEVIGFNWTVNKKDENHN